MSESPPENEPEEEHETQEVSKKKPTATSAQKITRYGLIAAFLFFIWYVASDRLTPYTNLARIEGFIVPVTPQVSGYIVEVPVTRHQIVEAGDVLLQLDKREYQLQFESAQAALENAGQQLGAQTAAVSLAAAQLGEARSQLEIAEQQYVRLNAVLKRSPDAVSKNEKDKTDLNYKRAQAQVDSALANLEQAQQQMGKEGAENASIKSAVAALEDAQLDLERTTLRAPSYGVVENLTIDVGYFAPSGQPLMSFISTKEVWVEAAMKENNIYNIEPGDRVDIILDLAPGKVFKGTVSSVGYGVSTRKAASKGELPTMSSSSGWLNDSQRFPVIIHFDDEEAKGLKRAGAQAAVVVYAGDSGILNLLGKLRIHVISWMSYLR